MPPTLIGKLDSMQLGHEMSANDFSFPPDAVGPAGLGEGEGSKYHAAGVFLG